MKMKFWEPMRNKSIWAGLFALAFFFGKAGAAEDYTLWSSYKVLTVNTGSTGANVAGTVSNFPMLVRLTSANSDVFTQALANGADIRFTAADGVTRIPHQRERWDAVNQLAEFWVLVPTVTGNSTTDIRMYWGSASAADSSSGGQVFTASNGYVGVWHMGDAPGIDPRPNAVSGAPSATPSNNFSGASFGGGAGTYVIRNGIVGKADTVRGGGSRSTPTSTSDYFNIGNSADNTSSPYTGTNTYAGYSNFTTGYTFSLWFKPTVTSINQFQYLSELANTTNGNTNIQVFRASGSTRMTFENLNGATTGGANTSSTGNFAGGTWAHYVVAVGTGSTPPLYMYKNGATNGQTGTTLQTQPLQNISRTNAWLVKSNYTGDGYMAGVFDEVEISNVARSADWVKLSYESQKAGATCVGLGPTQSPGTPPSGLSYTTPVTYTIGTAIANNTPSVTGTVTAYSVSPALPAGLNLNTTTGVISGTPTTAAAAANYTVTASNGGGSTTATVNITVNNAPPSGLSYTTPVTYTIGAAITDNTPTVTGTVTSYAVSPALPAGLSLNTVTGVISGTPTTATAAADYIVTATNGGGSTTATVNITVNNSPPSGLSYTTPVTYTIGTAITNNVPTVTGTVTSYSVSPALPAGLSLNTSTGVISGTPTTAAAAANYTVTATNGGGSTTATVNITVNNAAPSGLSYTTPVTYTIGAAITDNTPTVTGTVTSYSVSPALPAGLSLNTSTGVISGVPTTATAAANYVVTATNGGGSTTATVNITVNNAPPSGLSYTTPVTYTIGTAITSNTPTVTGTVTSYSVSPALPAGLSLNTTTGVISGVPTTAAAAANYTVTATNSGGSTTATVNITVNNAAPSGLSYTTPVTYTIGAAITNNSPTVTGSVASYSVTPALPAGLSLNTSTGVISGTPTIATAAANYTVTATNSGGSTTATVNITVNNAAPSGLSYTTPVTYTIGAAITNNSPTVTGSVTSYSVTPALPAGLSLNTSTGVISGTPTTATAAANYVVTATNSGGSTTATVNITVNSAAPSGLSYATPVTYAIGGAITNNSPTVTGTVTSYSVSPALPAGLSLNTSTGVISGVPTTATASANYVVTATNSGGSTTFTINITVSATTAIGAARTSDRFLFTLSGMSALSFPLPAGVETANLSIIDMRGRAVWKQTVRFRNGQRSLSWNGGSAGAMRAGVYLVRLSIPASAKNAGAVLEKRAVYTP